MDGADKGLALRPKTEAETVMENLATAVTKMSDMRMAETQSDERIAVKSIQAMVWLVSAVVILGFATGIILICVGKSELGTPVVTAVIGGVFGIFAGRGLKT